MNREELLKWAKENIAELDLEAMMRAIGNRGFVVFIKCDPYRMKNCFTVMINNQRIDTDDPLYGLCELAHRLR